MKKKEKLKRKTQTIPKAKIPLRMAKKHNFMPYERERENENKGKQIKNQR